MKKITMTIIVLLMLLAVGCNKYPIVFELVKDAPHTEFYINHTDNNDVKTRVITDTTYLVRALKDIDGVGLMNVNIIVSKEQFYKLKIGHRFRF